MKKTIGVVLVGLLILTIINISRTSGKIEVVDLAVDDAKQLRATIQEIESDIARQKTADVINQESLSLDYVSLARTYGKLGNKDRAEDSLLAALEANPKSTAARIELANIAIEDGNDKQAIVLWEEILEINPREASNWLDYASLRRANMEKIGIGKDDVLLELTKIYTDGLSKVDFQAPMYAALARVREEEGDIPAAIALWQQASTSNPNFADAYSAEVTRLQLESSNAVEVPSLEPVIQ